MIRRARRGKRLMLRRERQPFISQRGRRFTKRHRPEDDDERRGQSPAAKSLLYRRFRRCTMPDTPG